MMDRKYKLEREYSVMEIIRYNLRMWWLAGIFAIVCAAVLGGYKYVSNDEFRERQLYQEIHQIAASVYVQSYDGESAVERVGTAARIASSKRTYEKLIENTDYGLTYVEFQQMFLATQTEVSDVLGIYVNYPVAFDGLQLTDEESASIFMNEIIKALIETEQEMVGEDVLRILDAPYPSSRIQQIEVFSMSEDEFWRGVLKGATAGLLLGIIVEVAFCSFWMLFYRKPKDAEEIRQCFQVPVIDDLKVNMDNEEAFRKVALFLQKENGKGCLRVNCINIQSPKRDVASKLAMSYANSQQKTLFIDLTSGESGGMGDNSISRYLLGEAEAPRPIVLNQYLDMVCRSVADEDGKNIVMSERFGEYVEERSKEYAYIVINSADVVKSADAYAAAKLCDRNFIVCGRKTVKNENLYRAKNVVDLNSISIDGILVYEL